MKMLLAAAVLFIGSQSMAQEDVERNPAQSPTEKPTSEMREWNFAIGLGLATSSTLTFNDGKYTASGVETKLEAELEYKPALVLNLEARNMAPRSWGFIGGVQFDTASEIDSGKLKEGGVEYTLDSRSDSKIQVTNIFANAVYQWDQLYFPFGLNFSSVKFTADSGATGTSDWSGGMAIQLGLGVLVNEHFAFETQIRTIQVNGKYTDSSGKISDYGMGILGSWVLMAKYIF